MTDPKSLNPWKSIWMHPKETMRHILDNYPTRFIHLLAIGGAFTRVVSFALNWYSWWLTGIIWVCLAIFSGLFFLYIFGGLLKWTGGWLDGKASYQDIRASIAWAQIPVLAFFIVEVIILAIAKGNGSSIFYATALFVFGLWSAIILLCCLAEAQQISFFKALINYIIASVILIAAIVIVVVMVTAFSGSGTQ